MRGRLPRRWKVLMTAAAWTAVVLIGLAAGSRIQSRMEASRREEGLRLARQAMKSVRAARSLEAAGSIAEAEDRLQGAVSSLRKVEGANRGDAYAALLVDLASLRLRSGSREPPVRGAARTLFDEAWNVPDTTATLRARIARDRGALEALEGDLEAAESWYARALQEDPEDTRAARELRILRRTRGAPSHDAP